MGVRWTGLEEFKSDLHGLPKELAGQAEPIVRQAAQGAKDTVQRNYPTGPTGNLKSRVRIDRTVGMADFNPRVVVRSMAGHAGLFERGTKNRVTTDGANRGRMPVAPESQQMIPTVIRARRMMVAALIRMVEAAGLKVTAS